MSSSYGYKYHQYFNDSSFYFCVCKKTVTCIFYLDAIYWIVIPQAQDPSCCQYMAGRSQQIITYKHIVEIYIACAQVATNQWLCPNHNS